MSIYDFSANLINGEEKKLKDYEGNVLLIVNTATECGFTEQLVGLQKLYELYNENGFYVLGFPCNQFGNQEPGESDHIENVCTSIYGVTFPMFEKIDVNGENAHPLFKYLKDEARGILSGRIKWNFTKFLVDRKGNVVKRFAPTTEPEKIQADIELVL